MRNRIAKFSPDSFRSLLDDARGLSTVEYVIILVLVAVMAITTWQNFGFQITGKVKESAGKIGNM